MLVLQVTANTETVVSLVPSWGSVEGSMRVIVGIVAGMVVVIAILMIGRSYLDRKSGG